MEKRERVKNQSEALEQLAILHVQHPDYPIIPMVDPEVVGDVSSSNHWMGRLGQACIRKLFSGNKAVHEYEEDPDGLEVLEVLDDAPLKSGELDRAEEDDKYAAELYKTLSWTDCIVLYIDTP